MSLTANPLRQSLKITRAVKECLWPNRRSILAAKAGAEGDGVAGVVARLEGEIDDLVFALYGLTDDEIALVKGE